MNKVFLSGRLTKDLDVKKVRDTLVANGTIAVDRNYGSEETDFFVFSVWGKTADIMSKYTKKGSRVLLTGQINIDQAGDKYYTKIKVDSVEFLDRPDGESKAKMSKPEKSFKFEDEEEEDDLPF